MPPRRDLAGMKFGELTVLSLAFVDKYAYWTVLCSCGKKFSARSGHLLGGRTLSCGHQWTRVENLTGKVFDELTVLSFSHCNGHYSYWRVRCSCGRILVVRRNNLTRERGVKSCGHLKGTPLPDGLSIKSAEYCAWQNMKHRCYYPTNNRFKHYGGRGITVCERWRTSFQNFYADMGPKPTPKHSIDRINNDLGYFKENCHWATAKQQRANQRPRKPRASRSSGPVRSP